jgi:hypothetical protein
MTALRASCSACLGAVGAPLRALALPQRAGVVCAASCRGKPVAKLAGVALQLLSNALLGSELCMGFSRRRSGSTRRARLSSPPNEHGHKGELHCLGSCFAYQFMGLLSILSYESAGRNRQGSPSHMALRAGCLQGQPRGCAAEAAGNLGCGLEGSPADRGGPGEEEEVRKTVSSGRLEGFWAGWQ